MIMKTLMKMAFNKNHSPKNKNNLPQKINKLLAFSIAFLAFFIYYFEASIKNVQMEAEMGEKVVEDENKNGTNVHQKLPNSSKKSDKFTKKLLKENEQEEGMKILKMKTFKIPEKIEGTNEDRKLADKLIWAWQSEGIFQIQMDAHQLELTERAMEADRAFVQLPFNEKRRFVSALTYSGYIGIDEEETAGEPDASEVFTITKDVPMEDWRVKEGWPGHGPVCWPNENYKQAISAYIAMLGKLGEALMRLVALGLELPLGAFTNLTVDGWHHMRVLHFPEKEKSATNGRGIGAHTDYGMLVLASQDEVGGLFIRPPIQGEWRPRNWLPSESAAGLYEHDDQWYFVPPESGTLTCFPGDMMQYLTRGLLLSTPHKVRLNSWERFALAYFHEPNFNAIIRPLEGLNGNTDLRSPEPKAIHYGTHFINMFLRSYSERITSKLIRSEGKLAILDKLREKAMEGIGN